MTTTQHNYPARLDIDYPEKLDRLSTFLRLVYVIPIVVILGLISASGGTSEKIINESGDQVWTSAGLSIVAGLWLATMLMIVVRQVYPRWWFEFALELTRFSSRVGAYFVLLTDTYPSTVDHQAVHLEVDYPEDVASDVNRWLPLVKWFLAIPHYIVLAFLAVGALFVTIVAWFAILFTGRYPRGLFDYVVGVGRWALRVEAYVTLLVTDVYPPFSLE